MGGIAFPILLSLLAPFLEAGDIEGRVVITRALTKKRVVVDLYAPRGGASATLTAPEDLSEWDRTVVFVDATLPSTKVTRTERMNQKNRRFEREVLVIPAGDSVTFPNGDPIFHNVFSLSKAKSFDLGYYPQGQTRTVRFEKPGPVQLFCHIHTNMNAAILVVPNSFFAQPSPNGEFRITNVPAGHYTLRLWHKSAGYMRQTIDVPVSGTVNAHFSLPLATVKSIGP